MAAFFGDPTQYRAQMPSQRYPALIQPPRPQTQIPGQTPPTFPVNTQGPQPTPSFLERVLERIKPKAPTEDEKKEPIKNYHQEQQGNIDFLPMLDRVPSRFNEIMSWYNNPTPRT